MSLGLRRTAWVALVFSVLVFGGLGLNAFAARNADPNPPTRIDGLVERLNLDKGNQRLLAQIQKEDEWLRSSYVRSQKTASQGFALLLGGITVFLVCLKASRKSAMALPDPTAPLVANQSRLNAQQGVLTLGLGLGGVLTLAAVFSRHDTISSYVADDRMPEASGVMVAGEAEPAGTALAVLPPSAPANTSLPSSTPAPLAGSLPVESTNLVPMPVAPPPPTKPTTPPKKAVTVAPKTAPGTWPMFRGPGANGIAFGEAPLTWDGVKGEAVAWKSEIPLPGNGSPVVWEDRVFLSGATERQREVFAFDRKTGNLLWRTPIPMVPGSGPMKESHDTGFAPGTMAVDSRYAIAMFVNGDVAGLDHQGKLLWSLALGTLDNPYGHASSPVLVDGKLVLQVDQNGDGKSMLMALDPGTGKAFWAVKRPVQVSWSTPLPVRVDGRDLIVTCANSLAIAHDLKDGKEVWRSDGLYGEIAPSPAAADGIVYAAQMGAGLFALGAADGKLLFTNSELSLPDISSPLCIGGRVFFSGPDGTVTAVEAKSGKLLWEQRQPKPARGSPIALGSRLYLTDIEGNTTVFEAGDKYRELARNPLGEKTNATPAFVDGRIFIRGAKHLFCLGAS